MASGDTFRITALALYTSVTRVAYDYGYLDNSGGSTSIDTSTAAGDWWTAFGSAFKAALTANWELTAVRCACTHGPHAGEIGYATYASGTQAGSNSGTDLPSEVAISLKRATGYTGRNNRGRVFFGPVVETFFADLGNGIVDTGNALLVALRDIGAATFTTQTVGLEPRLVNGAGVAGPHKIITVAIGGVNVQRKSRRLRSPS